MIVLALVLSALTIPEPPKLASEPSVMAPAAVYFGGAIADLASTEYFLAHGVRREANPLLRKRGVRIPLKLAIAAYLTHKDRRDQRRVHTKKRRIIFVAVHVGVVAWNITRAK